MRRTLKEQKKQRRGAIVVLAAVFLVIMLGMVAFAVDIGYLAVTKTELQVAADSAALAAAGVTNDTDADVLTVARQFANSHLAGGRKVALKDSDLQYGVWDAESRIFTPSSTPGSAVKVTVRTDDSTGGKTPLFFGRVFNIASVAQQASAVATVNPRDICFVVDLSGTMNNDTEPGNTATINGNYAAAGYPTIGSDLLNQVYADFGFNCTDGTEISRYIGQGLSGVSKKSSLSTTLAQLTSTSGPLSKPAILDPYHIYGTDGSTTRTTKAYRWIMEVQIPAAGLMPAAKPAPNGANAANYKYWKKYIDANWDKLGYRSYMQFMMDNGRESQPDNAGIYTSLSINNTSDCPKHWETTPGGPFEFPPREMPTHAGRRAIIAALQLIKERNQTIADANQRDWVSIVSFDGSTAGTNSTVIQQSIRHSLDSNYDSAMQACTMLQACSDNANNTATQTGLIIAYNHIKPTSQGGSGRVAANKIVVLLTDGIPNLLDNSTSGSSIATYIGNHPSSNFYTGSSYYKHDAALMQTSIMQRENWYLYPVGIGLGCDYGFMDRMARMGATANSTGHSPVGSGNPAEYEAVLTDIFRKIITNPKLRLVQ